MGELMGGLIGAPSLVQSVLQLVPQSDPQLELLDKPQIILVKQP
jgi:hypothetical protein